MWCGFFFSSRRRHTECRGVSWAPECVLGTAEGLNPLGASHVEQLSPHDQVRLLPSALGHGALTVPLYPPAAADEGNRVDSGGPVSL